MTSDIDYDTDNDNANANANDNGPEDRRPLPAPDELPELSAALRGLETAALPAPASLTGVDAAIRAAAQQRFAPQGGDGRARHPRTISLLPWLSLAAAASVAVVAGIWSLGGVTNDAPAGGHPAVAPAPVAAAGAAGVDGDINADGRLDIIDAYVLARLVSQRAHAPGRTELNTAWDRNADGVVDSADADAIALAAVALPERSMK